jgi:Rrf2 family protein
MMQAIADNQGVSRKYLDSIFASLKTAGLVRSRRGVGGGHLLAKEPQEVRLGDVLRALEGPLSLVDCVGDPSICDRSHRCVTRDVWDEVGDAIEGVLDNITLADLVKKHARRQAGLELDQGCPLNRKRGPGQKRTDLGVLDERQDLEELEEETSSAKRGS